MLSQNRFFGQVLQLAQISQKLNMFKAELIFFQK